MRAIILAAVAGLTGVGGAGLAGVVGGPREEVRRVAARATNEYTFTCRGGEVTRIVVDGDGDTDLDVYVYDDLGNLITKDDDNTDYCVVRFTPRFTGRFTVRVVNRGGVYNEYRLTTN